MPSTKVTGPSQTETKRSPVWAVAACVTMPDGLVRLMMKASARPLGEAVPGVREGRHRAQGVGEAAGAHGLLAGQAEGARERLVEGAGVEAADADLDEHDVRAVEGAVERRSPSSTATPSTDAGSRLRQASATSSELLAAERPWRTTSSGGRRSTPPGQAAMASISSGVEAPLPPRTTRRTAALTGRRRSRGWPRPTRSTSASVQLREHGQAEQPRHERAGHGEVVGRTPRVGRA